MFMSPYPFQIDSLHFHIMNGSLLKGKQIPSLLLYLQKHKKYDIKNPFLQYSGAVGSCPHCFFVYIKTSGEGGILIKIYIPLVEI